MVPAMKFQAFVCVALAGVITACGSSAHDPVLTVGAYSIPVR
jgi:hypothetical protein